MNRLIFGCGYLGHRVARRWRDAGDRVTVVTRSKQRAAALRGEGLHAVVADVTQPSSLTAIRQLPELDTALETLLFAVGYDRTTVPSIHQVYAEGFRNVLAAASNSVRRVLYISTTGVYGPAGGGWVDEQTPTNPLRDGGHASLAAEQALHASPLADRGIVLRLAGIYGPGRVPYLKQLKAGQAIAAPATGWLNLIHVDDAAQVVTLAADTETGSQLYCVSDGSPVVRNEYYGQVAKLIGANPPVFVDPPEDSPRAARAKADKRVSNKHLIDTLAPQWLCPSYREGLSSILGIDGASG